VTENVPDLTRPQVENLFEEKLREAFSQLGCFNLAVFGKTGVGKSTLVNAVFGRDVAATGMGSPVTRGLI
jgi:predicted GTPase